MTAYEALVRIHSGDWDDYVYRLYAALLPRLRIRLEADAPDYEDDDRW